MYSPVNYVRVDKIYSWNVCNLEMVYEPLGEVSAKWENVFSKECFVIYKPRGEKHDHQSFNKHFNGQLNSIQLNSIYLLHHDPQ